VACYAVQCRALCGAGYLRLHTSLGDLNVELHCDLVPRTCENFLGLCEMGYYNDTIFHRSIKNFMIQVCCDTQAES
jgi:cyclophilin family peptidyl-prolyl cis-trans isomerase